MRPPRPAPARRSIQLANTKIRAPWDGYVDDRYVEVGDYMRAGDQMRDGGIAPEPFLAVGAVNEHDVGQIAIGDAAVAKLVTGETVSGKVSFVMPIAPIPDHAHLSRRGHAAQPRQCQIARRRERRYRHPGQESAGDEDLARCILVLDDHGSVGVRVVQNGHRAVYADPASSPTRPDGMWIAGVPDHELRSSPSARNSSAKAST